MDRLRTRGRPALAREVAGDLHGDRPPAGTAVMTVTENLHRNGRLRRGRDGRAWRYQPAGSRPGHAAALMNDAPGTSAGPRTAPARFALQMSPHDAALPQQPLDQARGQAAEAG